MERYMLHLANDSYEPRHSRQIVHRARFLCSNLGASIRVVRVASSFIELDVSVEKEKFDAVVERLAPIGPLDNARHVVEESTEKDEGIREGIFYFNSERFWEAHEAWEGAWKQCLGDEKSLVQGIILVAVAFAHSQKNDKDIGINMFDRALEKMGDFVGIYQNIDVGRIRKKISEMQKTGNMALFKI